MTDTYSRRDFLNVTTGAGAYATLAARRTLAKDGQAGAWTPPEPVRPGWFDRPMRWAQLTLVENDPGRFDPQFWLDYFRRIHADAACLSAGGIVAYYPTEVPLHHRSAWLGSSDPFGTLVAGCRASRHARHRPHRSACRARRGASRASGLDRRATPTGSPSGTGRIRISG